jgi:hypothetical protein
VARKKKSPTVEAVRREAKRTGGGTATSAENQGAAQRKALLKEVPPDIRKLGRKEATQDNAAGRPHTYM